MTLEGVLEGVTVGDVVTVTVVAGAVVVTVTVGLAAAVVGLAGAVVGLAAGLVVVGSAPVGLTGALAVAVRLWIALEMLETVLEHPAARHAAIRMATASRRLFVERRMLLLPPTGNPGTVVIFLRVGRQWPHPLRTTLPDCLRALVVVCSQTAYLFSLAASPGGS